ncbi:NAD(P)H azoreductase [bacterium BMS3Bbin04]|nr:NAD(P)H azoreductase [bacterium BMS3Bbin04]
MKKRVLLIGGHGNLGRPVARRLANGEFQVRAMVRNPDTARALLPDQVEIVTGDLRDVDSIRSAAEGVEIVYVNLSTDKPKSKWRTELDGTQNVLSALENRPEVLISKLSVFNCQHTGWWEDMDQKYDAEQMIRESGHPWLIFRPTWFYESLPMFLQRGSLFIIGKHVHPTYWIGGDDYARIVSTAFSTEKHDRIYNVQGSHAVNFEDAAQRFVNALGEDTKIKHLPLLMLRLLGLFNPRTDQLRKLMTWTTSSREEFISEDTFDELGRAEMTVEDYVEYMKLNNDRPEV